MTTIKTSYDATNSDNTGMSDDDFYGREAAMNVDIDACYLAALREFRRAADQVACGYAVLGSLRMRRAVYRLAVAVGNQSRAEDYIAESAMPRLPSVAMADEKCGEAQLDAAANRAHPLPELISALRVIDGKIAEHLAK